MAVRVDQNLAWMREVLVSGDDELAARMISADDDIDQMNVSLMERCYELLRLEAPLAGDLRLVVSVLRILSELERVGDLSLRVAKAAPSHDAVTSRPVALALLVELADSAIGRYRLAVRSWATMDLELATGLASVGSGTDLLQERLVRELTVLSGSDAVRSAIVISALGRTLDRIGDHAVVMGARIRYLLTGDPRHLAAEVR